MTKNILKSFFLVTLASLLLFSCTNVNDPTAVLESNGVVTTNKLVGLEIKKFLGRTFGAIADGILIIVIIRL